MLKPSRYYTNSNPKSYCTEIKVTFTINGEHIKTIINSFLNDISHKRWASKEPSRGSGCGDIDNENQLTRKMVEKRIKAKIKEYGAWGCNRSEDEKVENYHLDYDDIQKIGIEKLEAERKEQVDLLATRLFPDWFPPANSVKFIKDLAKENGSI